MAMDLANIHVYETPFISSHVPPDEWCLLCPFPDESALASIWHQMNTNLLMGYAAGILACCKIDPIETPFYSQMSKLDGKNTPTSERVLIDGRG